MCGNMWLAVRPVGECGDRPSAIHMGSRVNTFPDGFKFVGDGRVIAGIDKQGIDEKLPGLFSGVSRTDIPAAEYKVFRVGKIKPVELMACGDHAGRWKKTF